MLRFCGSLCITALVHSKDKSPRNTLYMLMRKGPRSLAPMPGLSSPLMVSDPSLKASVVVIA